MEYCNIMLNNKNAFTLAEMLITLGVIGVVSVLTIPNLIKNYYEKRTVSQLREVQSILSQALRQAEEEYGDVYGWGLSYNSSSSDAQIIADNIKPFLKLAQDCGLIDNKGICASNTTYPYLNGGVYENNYSMLSNYYKIKLLNGAGVWWRSGSEDSQLIAFFVDVNGKNLPNIIGRDLFGFTYSNNSIFAESVPCTKNSNGWGCAYYILQNGNMNYLKN